MAISTKKKNIIIAMWKTGEFKSYTAIAKHYKISTKTAQKIISDSTHENEDIVELGVKYEMAKKSTKNPHEINTIEKVVEERVKASNVIYDLTSDILEGLSKSVKAGKAQKVVIEGQGMGATMANVIDYDMQPEHYKQAMDTVDKASITLNVNQRHAPKAEINNSNNTQVNNDIVGYGVKVIEG